MARLDSPNEKPGSCARCVVALLSGILAVLLTLGWWGPVHSWTLILPFLSLIPAIIGLVAGLSGVLNATTKRPCKILAFGGVFLTIIVLAYNTWAFFYIFFR